MSKKEILFQNPDNDNPFIIRKDLSEDNDSIIDILRATPTSSSLSYVIDRSPIYSTFTKYQGYDHNLLVAETENKVVGSLSLVFDRVYMADQETNIAYTCDLRLDTKARGRGIGDSLMQTGVKTIEKVLGDKNSIFTCVFKDNQAGLKKNKKLADNDLAKMNTVAEVKSYFILPFSLKLSKKSNYKIRYANENDLENMFKLWQEISFKRNLARVFTYQSFKEWINNTAGIESYILAEKNNQLVGFFGLWNQSSIRRVIIYAEDKQIKFLRKIWNPLSKLIGIPRFPGPNQQLDFFNISNLCIKEKESFKELLYVAFKHVRKNNAMFLALALDQRDELNSQLKSFISSTTEMLILSNFLFENNDNLFHPEISLG